MGAAETIERIVAQCDFETQIVPYDPQYRDQVWAAVRRLITGVGVTRYIEVLDDIGLFYQALGSDATSLFDGTGTSILTASAQGGNGVGLSGKDGHLVKAR